MHIARYCAGGCRGRLSHSAAAVFVISGHRPLGRIMELAAHRYSCGPLSWSAGLPAKPRLGRISMTGRPRPSRMGAKLPEDRCRLRNTGTVEVVAGIPLRQRFRACSSTAVVFFFTGSNGQAHGGIVAGIGQDLRDHNRSTTRFVAIADWLYMDTLWPRATTPPLFVHFQSIHLPALQPNPLVGEGLREAGCAGALAVGQMNAL